MNGSRVHPDLAPALVPVSLCSLEVQVAAWGPTASRVWPSLRDHFLPLTLPVSPAHWGQLRSSSSATLPAPFPYSPEGPLCPPGASVGLPASPPGLGSDVPHLF